MIFECVGVPGMIQQCVLLAPPRGRIIVVGVCMQPDTIFPVFAIVKEINLRFVVGYRKQDFQLTLDMLAAERIAAGADDHGPWSISRSCPQPSKRSSSRPRSAR